jgi:hypothetical protein
MPFTDAHACAQHEMSPKRSCVRDKGSSSLSLAPVQDLLLTAFLREDPTNSATRTGLIAMPKKVKKAAKAADVGISRPVTR